MPVTLRWFFTLLLVAPGFVCVGAIGFAADDAANDSPAPQSDSSAPYGIEKRTVWTTSRVVGSPEPPLPYRLERSFPRLKFEEPVYMIPEPGTNRLFILSRYGKVSAFGDVPDPEQPAVLLELPREPNSRQTYSVILHPRYEENRQLLLFSNLSDPEQPEPNRTNRISRFDVSRDPPHAIVAESERVIIEWPSAGHDGGDMAFGHDGMLYITAGDGTGGSDTDSTGQDMTDLTSSIVRIDVDHPDPGKNYGIPPDNPFLNVEGARPEIWAFGLRAPWRMSLDEATGNLWVGDVGQDLWEMIHLVRRGANFGWSVYEGTHPFYPGRKLGPAPVVPPVIEHHHSEARSITGGYVYHGSRLKELRGFYLYCDYETGTVWGFRYEDGQVKDHHVLADSTRKVAAWGRDHQGELYLVGHISGEIFRLEPMPAPERETSPFPRTLSATGVFESVKDHLPAAGVLEYSVNAPAWSDGAHAERLLAIPGEGKIDMPGRGWEFEDGAVLVQTLSLDMERANPQSRRRIETRMLTRQGAEWFGYSYRWNDEQTDATLVDRLGGEQKLSLIDPAAPGGRRLRTWHFPGRAECMGCHSRAANYVLGLTTSQINREHDYGHVRDNQLRTFDHIGLFSKPLDKPLDDYSRLTNPYDETADCNARARSYLHVNCSQCHVANGGGNAEMELEFATEPEKAAIFGVTPLHGSFGITGAKLVAPGDPYRSVLYYRLAKLGPGRMPRLGSAAVDSRALDLFHEWISGLPKNGAADISGAGASDRPEQERLLGNIRALWSSESGAPSESSQAIERWLSDVSRALAMLRAIDVAKLEPQQQDEVVRAAVAHANPLVRELFERFLPEEQRVKRLGSVIQPKQVLALEGDADRGKRVFFDTAGVQCRNCHRIGEQGRELGPDLNGIGKKYKRVELLETLLEPSKKIDPKFTAYLLQTADGRIVSGLLVERTPAEIVLKDNQHNLIRVPAADVESLKPQEKSIMPEQLLRDLTAQQVADLLDYLASLN